MSILAENKKAYFDYEILDKYEAGLVLLGPEVKSAKNKQIILKGSYITFDKNNELWLLNAHIAPYAPAGMKISYDPLHRRKLLLRQKEIKTILGKLQQKGLTALPLKVYTKHNLIKIEIAICQGKKKYDKRESIKNKDMERQMRRVVRGK